MIKKKKSQAELDHLYLTHPTGTNSGSYDQIEWSSRIRTAARSPQARIVTVHEMLHSDLNNSTGFGTILIVLADICRKNPENIEYREILKKLVHRCRTVHEVFATTGGFILLDEESVTEELLQFYPDYLRYHQIGLSLCRPFKGFTLRYNSLYSVVRACMHSNAVAHVLQKGFDKFRLTDLRATDCPDNRLNILRFGLTDQFWMDAIGKAHEECPNQEFWKCIDEEEKGIRTNVIASEPRFDSLVDDLIRSLYKSATEVLRAKGIDSLSFNGHQEYTQPLLDSAKKLHPANQTLHPTLQASQDEDHEELIVRNLEYERLELHSPYEAQLYLLEEIQKEQWASLVTGEKGNEHFFICARPAAKLKKQYRFDQATEKYLDRNGNEPLLFIRKSGIDAETKQRIVQFFLVHSPQILDSFFNECVGMTKTYSSLSLSVYLNGEWKAKWNNALTSKTQQTLLMDISPTAVLKFWAKTDGCKVGYEFINLQLDDDIRSVLAFDFQTGKWPLVLAPCSSVTADGFIMYMQSSQVPENCFRHKEEVVSQNQFLLSVTLGHLFREEPWFDFQSPITQRDGGGMNG